jgi:organic radical activating enzyme
MRSPPYPLEGVASWNMNTTCNYRCSYCTQRFVDDRGQWAADGPRFVAAFLALPGDWEIKLSGGEPFQHPDFLGLVGALADGGRRVSVVTNLSASPQKLQRFAERTAIRPGLISASLHLEYSSAQVVIDKLLALSGVHRGRVLATIVATRGNLPLLPELRARFADVGLELRVQPEKQDRDVIDYSAAERAALLQLGGHNGTGNIDPDLSGRPCWAGGRYFVVDHKGDAWRCYPARRHRREPLGNLLDGSLRLNVDARPCQYSYCNCTVPQQRGMVDSTGAPTGRDHTRTEPSNAGR